MPTRIYKPAPSEPCVFAPLGNGPLCANYLKIPDHRILFANHTTERGHPQSPTLNKPRHPTPALSKISLPSFQAAR
jgi:hypothetical protein